MDRNLSILAASGFATSILTAYIISVLSAWMGVSLFTFSVWFIIPVGAIGCGFLAASGYYFASKKVHAMPSKLLLAQMIAIAACTQILIYWFDYHGAFLPGKSLAEYVSFEKYTELTLTQSHIMMGPRTPSVDAGEIGVFGYVIGFVQFIGFMAGGLFIFLQLKEQPTCSTCNRYLHVKSRKKSSFGSWDECVSYMDTLFQHPIGSPDFRAMELRAPKAKLFNPRGSIVYEATVLRCSSCAQERYVETSRSLDGQELAIVPELCRNNPIEI